MERSPLTGRRNPPSSHRFGEPNLGQKSVSASQFVAVSQSLAPRFCWPSKMESGRLGFPEIFLPEGDPNWFEKSLPRIRIHASAAQEVIWRRELHCRLSSAKRHLTKIIPASFTSSFPSDSVYRSVEKDHTQPGRKRTYFFILSSDLALGTGV